MPSWSWERNDDDDDALLLMLSLLLLMSSIGALPISWIMRRVFALMHTGEVWGIGGRFTTLKKKYTAKVFPKRKRCNLLYSISSCMASKKALWSAGTTSSAFCCR